MPLRQMITQKPTGEDSVAEEGDAEEAALPGDTQKPKKRRESGMLKQVKKELAEEAAARKAAATRQTDSGTNAPASQEGQAQKGKKSRGSHATAAISRGESNVSPLQNVKPQAKAKIKGVAVGSDLTDGTRAERRVDKGKGRHSKQKK